MEEFSCPVEGSNVQSPVLGSWGEKLGVLPPEETPTQLSLKQVLWKDTQESADS